MGLSEIVSVSISLSGANPTFANFGAGLFAAYHTQYTDRVRLYTSEAAVATDFPATSNTSTCLLVQQAAAEFFGANPSPSQFLVGRRALAGTCTYTLTALDSTAGDLISFSLEGKLISTTAGASTSATAAAINLAITSSTITASVTCAQVGPVITATATTAGHVLRWQNWNINQVDLENTTLDPGIATDMAAILNASIALGGFYGVTLDSQSDAEVKALASWVNTATLKELFFDSGDTSITSNTTTDLFSVLKSDGYARCVPLYNGNDTWSFAGVAFMAVSLVNTPGSYTLDLKELVGVTPDNLTDSIATIIQNKNGNIYRTLAGLELTTKGTNSNGGYEDTQRFTDWLTNTMQIRLLALLAGVKKLPYTDKGVRTVGACIGGVLQDGIRVGGLSDDPDEAPVVNLPLPVSGIAASYITARNLPNVTFQATLAGAIQSIPIVGTLIGA
jgi:Protein of unknown function (DUF3383)